MKEIGREEKSNARPRPALHINARIRPRWRTAWQDSLRFFGKSLSWAGLSQKFGTGTLLGGCMVENRKASHATPDTGEKMTKTPGNLEQPKPATKAEREARKSFRQVDAKAAMTDIRQKRSFGKAVKARCARVKRWQNSVLSQFEVRILLMDGSGTGSKRRRI